MKIWRNPGLPVALILLVVCAGAWLHDSFGVHAGDAGGPAGTPVTAPGAEPEATWKEADRLISEQKFEEALRVVQRIRLAAGEAGDDAEWTRALIREVQLRSGLHEYETAVRFLKEQTWPKNPYDQAALQLFYAESLLNYYRVYAWEINQRVTVASKGPVDLKSWTKEQILAEAEKAYREIWERRADLGETPVTRLAEYVQPNDYPPEIRPSLRDAVSYLYAALLSERDLWSIEDQDEAFRLDLTTLLGDPAAVASAAGAELAAHPLLRACALLADLESWHQQRGRREAALEARLERFRRLHEAFTAEDDRARITAALAELLPAFRSLPWWAMGQELLAQFIRDETSPDALVRARAEAEKGRQAFPNTVGGRRCLSIVKSIEAPGYSLQSMSSDGPGKRSVLVNAHNLRKLFFRAYLIDLPGFIHTAKDYNVFPAWQEIEKILREQTPAAEWSVDLPETPDYRDHKTFVTPPMTAPGAYVIAASARPAFGAEHNHIEAVNFLLTDLVLMVRQETDGGCEVRTLSGRDGSPVTRAEVKLYRYDWKSGHHVEESRTSDAAGSATFPPRANNEGYPRFLFARSGSNLAVDPTYLYLNRQTTTSDVAGALVYTDRSVYRPLQKLLWKVVLYKGSTDSGRYGAVASQQVTVELVDANNQVVESKVVTSNLFGSASGEFVVPSGRLLGQWYIRTSAGGQAIVSVEEYKRPTFEVSLKDPKEPLRLNRVATLTGDAKYYFGLPVVNGEAKWHVEREPVYPWWWSWYWGASRAPARTVAAGRSALQPDGTFALSFTPAADEREAARSREIVYRYSLTADVTDEGGETRSGTRSFTVGFVSVRARFDSDVSFFRAGEKGSIGILRTDLNDTPRPGKGEWKITALRQPERALLPCEQPLASKEGEYLTADDRQRPRWDPAYSPEAVMRSWADGAVLETGQVAHGPDGRASVALPALHEGAYRLTYETTDEFGATTGAAREFVVAGREMRLALPAILLAESSSVQVNGTARLLAHCGIPGQKMYVEIYRSGRLIERRTEVSGRDASLIEIPVGDADRGGFAVRLVLLRDHQLIDFSQSVFVPWDNKELKVEFATFRDKLRPGTTETWRVTVKEPGGAALGARAAELLAYMYDRSLDIFAPHSPPDPRNVYPAKNQPGWWKASLGMSTPAYTSAYALAEIPAYPSLSGDLLRFYGSYAIGGPGRRDEVGRSGSWGILRKNKGVEVQSRNIGGVAGEKDEMGKEDASEEKVQTPSSPKPSSPSAPGESAHIRSEFAETAFWMPHLLTNPDGTASFEFKVPDSVTSWNVWVHAVTRDLHGGSVRKEAKSVKELMVRPYVPRFLREGDVAELKVVVNNASDAPMSGRVTLDIVDPESNRSLLRDFGFTAEQAASKAFTVNAGGGANVVFPVAAPSRVGPVAFRVVATAGELSDGELRPVPILPGRVHLAQSRFVTLKGPSRREMIFEDLRRGGDPTRIDEQMVVTVDAQLFYGVLSAMPYLVNYPYECTEQTLNRFLSTGILSSLYGQYPAVARMAKELSTRSTQLETWDSQDPNRKMGLEETPWVQEAQGGDVPSKDLINVLDPRISRAQRDESLAKLQKAQTSLGAFPWWPGGPPSPYMTLYILDGFSRGLELGVEAPKETVVRAWQYMHRHYVDELVRMMMGLDCCWEFVTYLNYVLSSYPDSSWTGGVFTDADRTTMLDFSFRHWKQHSPYSKCQLALTLQRMKRARDAKLVFDSVMDSAHTTEDEGTFWAPEDRAWLWYNDTIETHAFALRTLMELAPKDARADGLVQWLFLNKKLNHWKSTKATAEVTYSLVHYLKLRGALGARESATVDVGTQRATWVFEPDHYTGKKNQLVIPGAKIEPETCSTVSVSKEGPGMAFASATWQFSTEKLPEEARGDFFSVTREYFKRENAGKGFVLTPIAEGAPVRVGDEVEVRLSIRAKHAAEYVHLRDPRAAGYEPVSLHSGYKWDLGITTYEEVRDSGENFFFENLPAGEYTFSYRIRASMAGTFKVAPATIQSMYAPEFNAYSAGGTLVVKP